MKLNKISNALRKQGKGALYTSAMLSMLAAPSYAMAAEEAVAEDVEVIEVRGMRGTMTRSLNEKKNTTAIVDAIAAADFGDLPGLSMSDVIENITSVSGHRGKGSASEISIRGMGPFLGWATANGRVVPSAGFARSSNFKKFPSDLSDKVVVYKSQQADLVEGGTAGTININSLRSLDYGKQKITFEATGLYNTGSAKLDNHDGLGHKFTLSVVDQLEDLAIGDLGYTFGATYTKSSNPEDQWNGSSNSYMCSMLDASGARIGTDDAKRCYDGAGEVTRDNYEDFKAHDEAGEVFIIEKGVSLRQIEDEDTRIAIVGSLQWQPSDEFDINMDFAHSDNRFEEDRHDLTVADPANYISTVEGTYQIEDDRELSLYQGRSKLYAKGELRKEKETYDGIGFNVEYTPTDDLTAKFDVSYAKSHRNRRDFQTRLFSADEIDYQVDRRNGILPELTFLDNNDADNTNNVDVNDPTYFSDRAKATRKQDYRNSEMVAARLDFNYALENDYIASVDAGVRFSQESLTSEKDNQWSGTFSDTDVPIKEVDLKASGGDDNVAILTNVVDNCFSEHNNPNWMDTLDTNGVTSKDSEGNVSVDSWTMLSAECAFPILTGSSEPGPHPVIKTSGDVDVTEEILAAYVMANIDTELFGLPVTGNVGVRVLETNISSVGYTSDFTVTNTYDDVTGEVSNVSIDPDPDTSKTDTFETENSVINVLPSLNLTFHLQDDIFLRTSVYKAIAKPDQRNMGAGRVLKFNTGSDIETIEGRVDYATGGNPYIEPLESNNADISLEWYPSEDTAMSMAIYYKEFEANFRTTITTEDITIDGVTFETELRTSDYIQDPATLTGLELSGQHNFAGLPYPWNGLGTKLSYNYTDTDFVSEDGAFGNSYDAETGELAKAALPGIDAATLFGSSKHTFSGSVYWEIDDLTLRALYKSRSKYYQPNTGAKGNRYNEPIAFVDLSAKYKINKKLSVSLKAQNILDEEQHMTRTNSTTTFVSSSGTKIALSLKAKF